KFDVDGETYELPRYLFVGPKGGDTPIRVGIFAGIHGDEPEGAHAIVQFIKMLEAKPELAAGYYLSFYPVCNPTGFEDGTRFSCSGKDLNREFWKNSAEPEVRLLQAELISRSFQGSISLHTDDTTDGCDGLARGGSAARCGRWRASLASRAPRPWSPAARSRSRAPAGTTARWFSVRATSR